MSIELRRIPAGTRAYLAIDTAAGAILMAGLSYRSHVTQPAEAARAVGAYCDNGIAGPGSRGGANRSVAAAPTLPAPGVDAGTQHPQSFRTGPRRDGLDSRRPVLDGHR